MSVVPLQDLLAEGTLPQLRMAIIEREEKIRAISDEARINTYNQEISMIRVRMAALMRRANPGVSHWVAPSILV